MAGHTLQIDPESELVFTLSPNEATPRCMMTLRHGGGTSDYIAFKVSAGYDLRNKSTYHEVLFEIQMFG